MRAGKSKRTSSWRQEIRAAMYVDPARLRVVSSQAGLAPCKFEYTTAESLTGQRRVGQDSEKLLLLWLLLLVLLIKNITIITTMLFLSLLRANASFQTTSDAQESGESGGELRGRWQRPQQGFGFREYI